jgi:hypothetical protein
MDLCQCGCGQECKPGNKYINGHYWKNKSIPEHSKRMSGVGNPNFGKTHSDDAILKIKQANIGRKHTKETRKKMSRSRLGDKNPMFGTSRRGKDNPNWKGGIQNDEYCIVFSDQEWRTYIYERDNYTCQHCGCTEQLSLKVHDRKLVIHHVDYNKKNCVPCNCITVCSRCNTIANGHRWMWALIYQKKLGAL